MGRLLTGYQPQTAIGVGLSNLAEIFANRPSPLEAEKRQAEVDYLRSRTAVNQAELRAAQSVLAAQQTLPRIFADAYGSIGSEAARPHPTTVGPMPAVTADEAVRAALPRLAGTAAGMGTQGLSQLGELFQVMVANAPGSSDDAVIRAQAGTGGTIGVNDAVSLAGQDRVAARNAQLDLNQSLAEIFATPIKVNAGATAYVPSGPFAGQSLHGRDTKSTAEGSAFNALPADTQALAVGPTKAQVQGSALAALLADPAVTEATERIAGGVQDQPSLTLLQTPDGPVTLDTKDPHAVINPVPARVVDESGQPTLGVADILGKIGTFGDDQATASRRTVEATAASLGITTEELDFLRQVQAQLGGEMYMLSQLPEQTQALYQQIMDKITASVGAAAVGLPGVTLPEGFELVQ